MLFRRKKKDGKREERESTARSEDTALAERNAGLPAKVEKEQKRALAAVDRREKALKRRANPDYNPPYVPYADPAENDDETIRNEVYEKTEKRIRFAKWGALIALGIYAVFMVFTYRDLITMENFRYLIRNVDLDIETGVDLQNSIVYDADPDNIFVKYRDYTAVINKRGLKIFDNGGRIAYSGEEATLSPAVITSSKYMLVYDRLGTGYSLYSYFTKLSPEKVDFTVAAAAVSDEGSYAIATRSTDFDGVVYVYNKNFKVTNRIQKNRTVASLDMTDDGSELLIASYGADDSGRLSTEITAVTTGAGESRITVVLSDVLPYECGYCEGGGVYLVCSNGIYSFDDYGKEIAFLSFDGINLKKYIADRDGFSLITAGTTDSSLYEATVFDSSLNILRKYEAGRELVDAAKEGDTLYLLYPSKLVCLYENEEKTVPFESPVRALKVICSPDKVLICTETSMIIPDLGQPDGENGNETNNSDKNAGGKDNNNGAAPGV